MSSIGSFSGVQRGDLVDQAINLESRPALYTSPPEIAERRGIKVSIDSTIANLNRCANDVEARLQLRRETLTLQFTRMEQAMSLLNSQCTWLSGQVQAMNRYDR